MVGLKEGVCLDLRTNCYCLQRKVPSRNGEYPGTYLSMAPVDTFFEVKALFLFLPPFFEQGHKFG
jgi:hypothetical protein